MYNARIILAAFAFTALLSGSSASFEDCLKKDSISCIQEQLFRQARDFFERPSFEVFGGLSLVKSSQDASSARSATLQAELAQEKLEKARSVEEKELTIENYVSEEARNFFEKRNLQWNMATLARNIADATPDSLKKLATELLIEGRGRRKKVLRVLLPFLLGLKVKFATILGLTYVGLIFLAKKAILLSFISIAISIFLLFKKMMHPAHEELYPYAHSPPVGWQSHSDSGHIEYAAHSAPIAQHLAYGAHKPARR